MIKRMKSRTILQQKQDGFTLPEILLALSLISLIAVMTLGIIEPWMQFRQVMDTDRKLEEIKNGLDNYYQQNSFEIESSGSADFGVFKQSAVAVGSACTAQASAFGAMGFSLSDGQDKAAMDGFNNPLCIFVGPQRYKEVDGARLYYRAIAVVSTGNNAQLDAGTTLNTTSDVLELGGDDRGITFNGFESQRYKYMTTVARLERLASMYETYFTTRFLQAADRDISRYYFSKEYDAAGAVASTGATYVPVFPALADIGVSQDLGKSLWEQNNDITFNNHSAAASGVVPRPRTPVTSGISALPYTAVLRAQLPSPSGNNYVARVAVGNY